MRRKEKKPQKKNMKKRVMLVFILFVIVGGFFFIRQHRRSKRDFTVREIVVDGVEYLDKEYVISRSEIEINSTIKKQEKEEILRRLKKVTWIQNVTVEEQSFGQLVIEVTERCPIAIVRRDKPKLLCSDGALIPYSDDFSDLPSVVFNSMEDLSPFISRIRKIKELFTAKPITIYFRENEETVVKVDGFRILIGSTQCIPGRSELYRIIEEMKKEGYSFCDVRFKNQIIFEKGGAL